MDEQLNRPEETFSSPGELQPSKISLPEKILLGLAMLLRAYRYAKSLKRDVWDFAVEIDRLRKLGLGECDFRLLAILKYTLHAQEITHFEADGREFRPVGNLSFPARTCFVLTDLGLARAALESSELHESSAPIPNSEAPVIVPVWDPEARKLMLEGQLVKHFKWPAVNQERILSAFEEESWPPRIDDPLPPQAKIEPKRRLHDTIKNLNKNQRQRLVHFRGDGTGEGVIWEFYQPSKRSP